MLKKVFPYLLILLTVVILFLTNYKPDTWLSGWDNLHPEFNFKLNLQREIYAGWQEYQGLGTVGGLMIAADIPRLLFLWLMSLVFSLSALRYIFTFLMLFLGPAGVFYLLFNIAFKTESDQKIFFGSLAGSFFYLLNLGMIQIFYAPFDPFVVFYGFLPWLIYVFIKALEQPNKRNFIIFSLVNLLAVPQNYVPTMFIVYLITLGLIGLGYYFKNKTFPTLKRLFLLFFLIFLVNSFWLFNFFYFIKTNIQSPSQSHMGYMSTENIYLQNKKYGDLKNVIKLKGFLFDFADTDSTGTFVYMMTPWKNYLDQKPIDAILVGQFLVIILGLIYIFKRKNKYALPFSLLFIAFFIFLANDTPIISLINDFLRNLPFFSQVFRVPFTKFGNLTIFSYAIFFGFGTVGLYEFFSKYKIQKVIVLLLISSTIIISFPAFSGQLIYEKLKVKIPQDYFDLMAYFDEKPIGNIALFPQPSYWNWNFYSWRYVGTGFLWYGIKQPTLDRAFDGYSSTNENYYWEISQSVYSKNLALFEKLLDKYHVNWLILDNSIIDNSSPKTLFNEQLRGMINRSQKINYLISFGKIEVYEVSSTPTNNFIYTSDRLLSIYPKYNWNNYDKAFDEYSNYFTSSELKNSQVFYPFRSLFTGKRQEDKEFLYEENDDFYIFTAQIPKEFSKTFFIPKIDDLEITEYDKNNLSKTKKLLPQVSFDETSHIFSVYVPKIKGFYSYDSKNDTNFYNHKPQSCNSFTTNIYSLENIYENGDPIIRLKSQDSSSCITIDLPNLTQQLAYLISIEAKNNSGKSLLINLINKNSKRKDIDTYLSKDGAYKLYSFIQPSMTSDGLGYSLVLDNISIGRQETINDIKSLSVNPIPYRFLTGIKFLQNNNLISNDVEILNQPIIYHQNSYLYKIDSIDKNSQLLILSQSFHPGWKAYEIKCQNPNLKCQILTLLPFFFGQELKNHVLVNNWANGWEISQDQLNQSDPVKSVVIIFWPQYLEFLGFGLLIITFLFILSYQPKN